MNPFKAPDVPISAAWLAGAFVDEIRSYLFLVQRHCLTCRLVGSIPHIFRESETQAYLSALVEFAARVLPLANLRDIECAALGAHHEARFLLRRTWAAVNERRRG
ncbi:hypothetical protein [Achromobacter mucicolens]|uniref:hypothetical protein n=1 Tax=Achromobacter mucicolens TaxID=1389922 RepID=UPI00289C462A|nr:hypothetical protein [Achromobacter mucicolens]